MTGYKIYLATTSGPQQSTVVAQTSGTSTTVPHLVNGTLYYFMVAALYANGGQSPDSAQVPAQPFDSRTVSLSSSLPRWLASAVAAAAVMLIAGAFTLISRSWRRLRSRRTAEQARSGQAAAAADIRAVPGAGRPDVMRLRETGQEPTHHSPRTTPRRCRHDFQEDQP